MAFKSKDGKNFGNRQQQKAYDERKPKTEEKHADHEDTEASHPAPDGDQGEQMPIEEMVANHGPAEEVSIHHDHTAGKHSVESTHGGKKHKSEHGSADEAHMHAAKAAGVTVPGEEQPMDPMGGGMPGTIPGM